MHDFDRRVRDAFLREVKPRYAVWVLYSTVAGGLGTVKVYANSLEAGLERFAHEQPFNTALAHIIRRAADNDSLATTPGAGFQWMTVPDIDSISIEAVKAQPVRAQGIKVEVTEA